MSARPMRHYIAIERRVPAGDGFTWQTFATVWAEKRAVSAREFLNNGDQMLARGEGSFVIRWQEGIEPTMRVRDLANDQLFNILGVLEDDKSGREWLALPYSRGTNAG